MPDSHSLTKQLTPISNKSKNSGTSMPTNLSKQEFVLDLSAMERLREIQSAGEAVSIAEAIARDKSTGAVSDASHRLPPHDTATTVKVTDLQRMSNLQLTNLCEQEQIPIPSDASKQELVFAILKQRVKTGGIMSGEGTLQILPDGFGFLRSPQYQYVSCPDDIYVSPSQIRKFKLSDGSTIRGLIRPPKENERYFALLRVDTVNGLDPSENAKRRKFDELTPLHPEVQIVLEHDPKEFSTRVIDLLTPLGFGQRALIVSPPRTGKTVLMQKMARAVLKNYSAAYVILLLIDERPEEVTDMEREVRSDRCEVIGSTFDENATRHIQVAEMVLEKAKRLVESGVDVVLFLDSITRLSRAYNAECQQSGKTMSGGLDANTMQKPKAFFSAARKLEEGGSLTIVATALIDTGSKMDDVIFEEFKGTGNLDIVLSRSLVERRIWPAIDIKTSGTRREEKLFSADDYEQICLVRRSLSDLNPPEAMDSLTTRLKKTKSNSEFLQTFSSNS